MIVEDEPKAINVLESHISAFADLQISSTHHNAMEAFVELQRAAPDILFLDIQLPKMSGIQLLHSLTIKPAIILTTAYREFALECYELEISDYLLKPISLERFTRAIAKVYKNRKQTLPEPRLAAPPAPSLFSEPFIYVKSEREYVKVLLKNIRYIESLKNHLKLVTTEATHITLMSLSQLEEKLPPQHFLRIHRSYLISRFHLDKFTQANVSIDNATLPIGQLYKQKFMEWVRDAMV